MKEVLLAQPAPPPPILNTEPAADRFYLAVTLSGVLSYILVEANRRFAFRDIHSKSFYNGSTHTGSHVTREEAIRAAMGAQNLVVRIFEFESFAELADYVSGNSRPVGLTTFAAQQLEGCCSNYKQTERNM